MSSFPNFVGNDDIARTLRQMIDGHRISQTILLSGPEGLGKATLARRFAATLLGDPAKIEQDDLSRPENIEVIDSREKWTADKRADDPLVFSSHPDFLTFPPDGPLRQISIQQMRLLRERSQFKPLRGAHRVFLIDRLDKANEQAANSLLKILEEPPEHLVIIATAENLYDLLPTIRSRSIVFQLCRLNESEMREFAGASHLDDPDTRIALAEGSPGAAANLDLDTFRERRGLLLTAFECAAGVVPFSDWVQRSESFSTRKSERLDLYLKLAYTLVEDILAVSYGSAPIRNRDVAAQISKISASISTPWIESAVRALDELAVMVRRNIQKTAALDGMIINLRNRAETVGA